MILPKHFSSLIILTVVFLSAFPVASGQSADETVLRAVVEKYLAAYAQEDLYNLTRLWSERSPDLAQSVEKAQELFTIEDYTFANLTVSNVRIISNRATLQFTVDRVAARKQTGETRNERLARNFAFIKERGEWKIWRDAPASEDLAAFLSKEGGWRISGDVPVTEQFATALVTAASIPDRNALLDENQELLTVNLREALVRHAAAFQRQGNFSKAMDTYRLAQAIAECIGDKQGAAISLLGMGDTLRLPGDLTQALRYYQQALARFEELKDRAQAAATLSSIGAAYLQQRDYRLALETYNKALAQAEALKNPAGIASALEDIGSVYYEQEQYPQAIAYFEKCLKLRETLGKKSEIAATLNNIGTAYYYQEDYETAIGYFQKAIAGFESANDRLPIAAAMNSIASAFYSQGNHDAALEYYQKGLKLEEELGDRQGAATSLSGIGLVHYARGDFALAVDYFSRSLALLEVLRDKAKMAATLHDIGEAHFHRQDYDAALASYQKSLALSEEQAKKADAAATLIDIGGVHYVQGNYDLVLERYRNALAYFESLKETKGIAAALGGLAAVYYTQRRYEPALEFYQKSLAHHEASGESERVANTIERIASVQYWQGNYAQALESAARAAALARQIESYDKLWQARFTAGLAHRALNQPEEARRGFEEAITTIENMRAQLTGGEGYRRFFRDRKAPYLAMMELLVSQNKVVEAFAYAEGVKARAPWDALYSGRVRVTKSMTPGEQEQERKLSNALASLKRQVDRERQRPNKDEARLASLNRRLQKARREYDGFITKLYAARPRLKALRGESQPLRAEEAGRLPEAGHALLEFVVTEGGTYLFAFTKESSAGFAARPLAYNLKVYVLNIGRAELTDRVAKFRELIEQRSDQAQQPARELYDLLLKPAAEQLRGKSLLVIAPDSALWGLPFPALQSAKNHYLVEDHACAFTPSLTALRDTTKPRRRVTGIRPASIPLLAFANPVLSKEALDRIKRFNKDEELEPMPQTEDEVKALRQLYGERPSRVYTGAAASEERLKAEAESGAILHLAAPASLNDASPMYSQVLLSQAEATGKEDGFFQAWEMSKLNLKANIVVMSACESAHEGNGDGLTGMSWALFVAGCPTAVLSRWRADSGAADFALEFHRQLKSRIGPAQALRQAAMKMLKGQYAHPFYWARFTVVGGGK